MLKSRKKNPLIKVWKQKSDADVLRASLSPKHYNYTPENADAAWKVALSRELALQYRSLVNCSKEDIEARLQQMGDKKSTSKKVTWVYLIGIIIALWLLSVQVPKTILSIVVIGRIVAYKTGITKEKDYLGLRFCGGFVTALAIMTLGDQLNESVDLQWLIDLQELLGIVYDILAFYGGCLFIMFLMIFWAHWPGEDGKKRGFYEAWKESTTRKK